MRRLAGTPGGPDTAALLQTNAVLGTMPEPTRYRPPWPCCPCLAKAVCARAARSWLWADGQGIVLAPPAFTAQYLPVRRFLAMALGLAKQRCASYHI